MAAAAVVLVASAAAAAAPPVYGGDRTVTLEAAEARAAHAVTDAFEDAGARAPGLDAGLSAAARELAGRAIADGLDVAARQDEVRLALARGGATVPAPVAIAALASDEAGATGRLAQRAREAASGRDRPDRFGVGLVRDGDRLAAVLLLGRRRATIAAFPARVDVGSTHVLAGQLLPPLGGAEVQVTPPGGKPVRLPGGAPGASFRAPVAFGSRGRWAVEVLGHGPRGPEVALLLEVWAGEPIPKAAPATPRVAAEPPDLAGKAALVAREVNELRKSRGLRPLALDATLTRVAKAYAGELARTGRFAHRSPESGDPADRVKTAGYRYRRIAENLAQAPTARAAHQATVDSPGHLANLLDPEMTEAGYFLAWGKNPDGSPALILVELFGRPAER
jgi:uncharacterized protein YkwD